MVGKILCEHIIPYWGVPREVHSDRGTHFTGKGLRTILEAWGIHQHLHCAYHPQSSGIVDRTNGVLKGLLGKLTSDFQAPWIKVLPIALLALRSRPVGKTKLSPYEIVTGRPMPLTPADLSPLASHCLQEYCVKLSQQIHQVQDLVSQSYSLGPPPETSSLISPGDWVYWKRHLRKHSLEPRWKGPFQVLLTTSTAAKLQGIDSWIHLSHLKLAPAPEWTSEPIGDLALRLRKGQKKTTSGVDSSPKSPDQACAKSNSSLPTLA